MASRINPNWQKDMLDLIERSKNPSNLEPFCPVILSWNPSANWLVSAIAKSGQIPKVENLGAGVKRISIKGTCCPTCGKEKNEPTT